MLQIFTKAWADRYLELPVAHSLIKHPLVMGLIITSRHVSSIMMISLQLIGNSPGDLSFSITSPSASFIRGVNFTDTRTEAV